MLRLCARSPRGWVRINNSCPQNPHLTFGRFPPPCKGEEEPQPIAAVQEGVLGWKSRQRRDVPSRLPPPLPLRGISPSKEAMRHEHHESPPHRGSRRRGAPSEGAWRWPERTPVN